MTNGLSGEIILVYYQSMQGSYGDYNVQPLSPERWDDFEKLFGPSGGYSGCWCMWWRLSGKAFSANGNAGNRAAIQKIVEEGPAPGLLAYREGAPVGWLSLGPRPDFGRVNRSPLFKVVDETSVWSIVWFFIHREHRRQGVASALLAAAMDYDRELGAPALEAYPVDVAEANESQKAEANL